MKTVNPKKTTKANDYQYVMMSPNELKSHPLNVQLFEHNDSNHDVLLSSMRENGFLVNHPILCYQVGKSLVVVSGHRRVRAAIEIGIDQVPVSVIFISNDSEVERIMVEENLLRPQEGRKLSQIERYILALRLSSKFPERRGGDRRSSDFIADRNDIKPRHKEIWLAEKTGLCTKYISQLNVIAKNICKETLMAYPELLAGIPLYEQLQIILNQGLSAELSALQVGTTISTLYNKYRASKPKSRPNPPVSPQITDVQVNHLRPAENAELTINPPEHQHAKTGFVSAFKGFLLSEFATHENLNTAIKLLSDPPQGHIATLKSVQKVATLLLRPPREQGVKAINIEANQSLPLFLNFETGGLK